MASKISFSNSANAFTTLSWLPDAIKIFFCAFPVTGLFFSLEFINEG